MSKLFSVRDLMIQIDNIPFASEKKQVKKAYMWRDIKRKANKYESPESSDTISFSLIANSLQVLTLS